MSKLMETLNAFAANARLDADDAQEPHLVEWAKEAEEARDTASELLDVLRRVRGWYVEQYGEMYALANVDAVIAKAEG